MTKMIICTECDGEGTVEIGPTCWKPASMCCGGCYETHRCEECDGTGKIETECDEEVYD